MTEATDHDQNVQDAKDAGAPDARSADAPDAKDGAENAEAEKKPVDTEALLQKLSIAKTELLNRDPFLGSLLVSLRVEKSDDPSLTTMCTNGKLIQYNDDFADRLGMDELVGVLAHEVMHVALLHVYRARKTNAYPTIWNIAADYVVNRTLTKLGFTLPEGGLVCPADMQHLPTEIIYKELEEKAEKIPVFLPSMQDLKSPPDDDVNGGGGDPDSDILSKIQGAIFCSRGRSYALSACSEIERSIDELVRPALDWKTLLRNFCTDFKLDDYSWKLPSRRGLDSGYYLPALCEEGDPYLRESRVYMDVSGSISDPEMSGFLSEISYLFEDMGMEKLTLQSFSIGLTSKMEYDEYSKDDIIKYHPESRGGTEIESVVKDIHDNPALLNIIFTDGYFDESPLKDLNQKNVFWVVYGNRDFVDIMPNAAVYDPKAEALSKNV
ncbi:MAG: hypothetical protein IJ523_10055 [Succinivibrionaceae bacterium]|nr:hypothetical protein [Succinivibrionaceae bacterium]